jgi:hypothetical protein
MADVRYGYKSMENPQKHVENLPFLQQSLIELRRFCGYSVGVHFFWKTRVSDPPPSRPFLRGGSWYFFG